MKDLEAVRRFFQADRFAAAQDMVIEQLEGDRAVCSVILRDDHKNAVDIAQGGLIFTLADFAFAVAVNHEKCNTVTLNSSVQFLQAATEGKLYATTACKRCGKHICVYQIDVTDHHGNFIAMVTTTGYTK